MTATIVAPVERGAIDVAGQDRASYLHAVLTQDVEALGPGSWAGALHLDAHGRPLAVVDVVVLTDRIVLLAHDSDAARELADTLASRTFLADARFATWEVAAVAVRGPRTHDIAADAGVEVASGTAAEVGDVVVVAGPQRLDAVGEPDAVTALRQRLTAAGAEPADAAAVEAWRVEHGAPAWGREIVAPHLPEEMGLLPTHVHLDKGCYPGQEAVARMWMLGRPRRRLARVRLEGEADAGWTTGSGRAAAQVTSATTTPDGDRVGLAYVPATAQPGDRYGDDAAAVVVRDLVGSDLPVPGHDPAVARRRDRRAG